MTNALGAVVAAHELETLGGLTFLVTGADGMLGRAFVEALAPLGRAVRVHPLTHDQLDVTDVESVLGCVRLRPNVILHCAGLALADRCEQEPALARRVHVGGTENIGRLALQTGARVFYPQSVFIFDGLQLPVTEETLPAPGFVYGQVKLEAERHLLAEVPNTLSVRMAGFFGGDEKDKNFVGKFVRQLEAALGSGIREIEVGDRVWQPTYTLDLARNTLLLIAKKRDGIYHMGSVGEASFFDVARRCVTALDLDEEISIVRCPSTMFDEEEPAHRPTRMVTANARLVAEGLCRQRAWQDSLREYLHRPYFNSIRRVVRR